MRMLGGLGNQMFQHAAGTALARLHGCELFWDLSGYESGMSSRNFELNRVFGLSAPIADKDTFSAVLGWRGHPIMRTIFNRGHCDWCRPRTYIKEPFFQYWPEFWSIPDKTYLEGYWQSEWYFKSIADEIRRSFTFVAPLSIENQILIEQITRHQSVSVHIRRGDYISNLSTNHFHGCCSLDYYFKAAQYMMSRLGDCHFFVFSDDTEWVKENLSLPASHTFVNNNQGQSSYYDMQLMSLCQHHIIANSSFSWWGAWLGKRQDAIVVAPNEWFKEPAMDTRNLYCPGWVRI